MLKSRVARGFTLVELLLGIAILSFLLALGGPALSTYLQNAKLSSVAETFYAGLQRARSEAVRRNVQVQFVLTNTSPAVLGAANGAVVSTTGSNWLVRAADPANAGAWLEPPLDSRLSGDGEGTSGPAVIAVTGSASSPGVFTGSIGFNGFGATADGFSYALDFTNNAGTCIAQGGLMRCRRVRVTAGGQISICDPSVAAPDSRAC